MAKELSITASIKYTPSVANQEVVEPDTISITVDMTGSLYATGTKDLTSTAAVFVPPATAGTGFDDPGWCLVKNIGSDTVEVGTGAAEDILVKVGEFALFRTNLTAATLKAAAQNSTSAIQYWVFQT